MTRRLPKVSSMPEDAIDEEEMASTAVPGQPSINRQQTPPPERNAFIDLMSPKRKHPASNPSSPQTTRPKLTTDPTTSTTYFGRDGLGAYIASPTSFPPSRVISHTPDFVVINDLYPKSSVHILLLPRSPQKTLLHPFDALSDAKFLASVQTEVTKLRTSVAKELRRRYGKFSSLDKAREEAMDQDPPPSTLPAGRDWEKEVIAG
ncbi:MAG: aprataxin-like protein, partial [Candelina submexicana]